MMLPDKRKPADGTTGFLADIEVQGSKFDTREISPTSLNIQAVRIRDRFGVSMPLAGAIAELVYGRAAA